MSLISRRCGMASSRLFTKQIGNTLPKWWRN